MHVDEVIVDIALRIINAQEEDKDKIKLALFTLCKHMNQRYIKTLEKLIYNGPLQDGDIYDPADRNALISMELAIPICVEGKCGFIAATHRGYDVYHSVYEEKVVSVQT